MNVGTAQEYIRIIYSVEIGNCCFRDDSAAFGRLLSARLLLCEEWPDIVVLADLQKRGLLPDGEVHSVEEEHHSLFAFFAEDVILRYADVSADEITVFILEVCEVIDAECIVGIHL